MRNMSFIKLCLTATVLVFSCGFAAAQPIGFADWSSPENLGPSINTMAFEGCPFVADDGLDLLFASNRKTGSGPGDLYVSHRETPDSPWGAPVSLGANINRSDSDDACPILIGQYLYFNSNRPGGCGNHDIYRAERLDPDSFTSWSAPVNLGCQVNSPAVDGGASFFEDENGTLHLYFHSNRTGGLGLADIYVSRLEDGGGNFGPASLVPELNTPFLDIRAKIRRDGLEIFFESDRPGSIRGSQDIYTATRASTSLPWSKPVNLGLVVNTSLVEGGPALSFDGTELYFMSNRLFGGFGNQDIYVSRREMVHSLAFYSNRDGNNEVYVMNSNGSNQTRLTNHTGNDQRPDISLYGNHVAFSSNRVTATNPEGDFEIFLMNPDGSSLRQLTFNNAVDSWPRFSPDGKWIAFHSNVDGNFEIYVMRPNGTALTRVTDYSGLDQFPEWSPNGRRLAIRRDNDLYLIDTDGANAVRLTATTGINQMASFSPDGRQIAFMSNRAGYTSVFVMNADGSNQVNLTPRPDFVSTMWGSRAPGWSRNGRYIYFTGVRPETGANENIWVMNADGTGGARLTFAPGMSAEAAVR